jgi:hypothetical protein
MIVLYSVEWLVNNELQKTWKETAAVVLFEALSTNVSGPPVSVRDSNPHPQIRNRTAAYLILTFSHSFRHVRKIAKSYY